MQKTAFIFPGQGSQSVGMLKDLAEQFDIVRDTFTEASEVLSYDLWALSQEGPEERLNQTEVTQPAMLAAGIATWRCWQQAGGGLPATMAGHSLGEYSALVASGALEFSTAVSTVALRGRLMQDATPAGSGAMAAILGLDDDVLQRICADREDDMVVSCANFNSPGQVVIAGHREAVEAVCEQASTAGARRAIVLPVSVPSHCALMQPAAERLRQALTETGLKPGDRPVIQNADVRSHTSSDAIIDALTRQLYQPVRWTETILHLKASGIERFVECGPGRVLAGLNRRITRESETVALIDAQSIQSALEGTEK
jgi:[acyl-carrier-protein] S-malonyltransferase